MLGCTVGCTVGWPVGDLVGCPVGWPVGDLVGCPVGCREGCLVGCLVGCWEGCLVGCPVGCPVGIVSTSRLRIEPPGAGAELSVELVTLLRMLSIITSDEAGVGEWSTPEAAAEADPCCCTRLTRFSHVDSSPSCSIIFGSIVASVVSVSAAFSCPCGFSAEHSNITSIAKKSIADLILFWGLRL